MMARLNHSSRGTISVSVVIPCYNCVQTLSRALNSVIEQTQLPEKIILVNDASTDTTKELITSYKEQYPAGWLELVDLKDNHGPAYARNQGMVMAKSDYIAFLDADDTWHPKKLETQYLWMQAHPEISLTGHRIMLANDLLTKNLQFGEVKALKISKWQALLSNPFSTPTVMMKSNLPYYFKPGQHHAEDYLLWLQVCIKEEVYRLDAPMAYIHKATYGEGGLSQSLIEMEKGELNTYRSIYDSKEINLFQYFSLVIFSLLKFVRRALLSKFSGERP